MTQAGKKVIRHRMSALQLAEAFGNVSEACRRRGVSRTQFYEYKRRFQTHGLEGLKDLPPIHKTHPMTTPPEENVRLEGLVSEHNMKHAKPDYLVVPFILFNLAGPDRQEMAKEFPPIVTEQLIPVAWKDQWAPMKPFLLP